LCPVSVATTGRTNSPSPIVHKKNYIVLSSTDISKIKNAAMDALADNPCTAKSICHAHLSRHGK